MKIKNFDGEKLITESLGAFQDQYALSKEISDLAYYMFMKNIKKNIYNPLNNKEIKVIDLTVLVNPIHILHATIIGVNGEDGKVIIELHIPEAYRMANKDKVINAISNVVVHELMHGNVYIKRINNKVDNVVDTPFYYDKLIYILRSVSEKHICRKFAYALYSTYYQEVNAMVSQANIQLSNIIGYGTKTNDEIKNNLPKIEAYQIYNEIVKDTIPKINSMTNEEIENNIVNIFKQFNIQISVKFVRDMCKKMNKIATEAIKNIIRNTILERKIQF